MATIGERDRRVALRRRTVARDPSTGRDTITWPLIAMAWAARTDLSGRELLLAQQVIPTAQVQFNIWWRGDLLEGDRIVCDGKNYDIQHLAEVGRREALDILTKRPDAS